MSGIINPAFYEEKIEETDFSGKESEVKGLALKINKNWKLFWLDRFYSVWTANFWIPVLN